MKKLLLLALLIVGCVYGTIDTTKTEENIYKYILVTYGFVNMKIVGYQIINDKINITKDGDNWEVFPLAQIKQITDLNGISIWEDNNREKVDKYDENIRKFSDREKYHRMYTNKEAYERNKKSPLLGIAYSTFLPLAGHIYVGKPVRGLLFDIPEFGLIYVGTSALVVTPFFYLLLLLEPDDNIYKDNLNNLNNINSFITGCFTGATIIHLLKIVDVYKEVKKYNLKLHKQIFGNEPPPISFKLQPTYNGANLSMTYSFK